MSTAPAKGLVVMAYGTPSGPDDVEAYYTHIRRGRPPTPEQLADLERRYAAIGGVSPLAERTRAQADAVATALDRAEPGGWRVALGMKHAPPFVEDAVAELAKDGAAQLVGLVLAPHWSRGSVGEYHERAAATAAEHGAGYAAIERWHDLPAWRAAMAQRVRDGLAKLPGSSPAGTVAPAGTAVPGGTAGPAGRTRVLFTAHSLPERVLADDPYADELEESAAAIAAEVGLEPGTGWSLAWQSAGRTPEPWRGPDILEVVAGLGEAGDVDGVLVCPQGFVSDHLEVLYDLDVDAARAAAEVGLAFARTASINDDPAVMAALADRVRACARP